jgi:hypothetical protein
VNAVEDGSYVDRLYSIATGWLGWSPEIAWGTPLPELFMAIDARIEWAQMTNPFGSKTGANKEKPKPSTVAAKIRQALASRRTG